MSDANSNTEVIDPTLNQEQVEPKQTNMVPQDRVNEITAEKYALQEQLKQQTALVADLMRKVTDRPAPQITESVPDGVDPALASFIKAQMKASQDAMQQSTQQMYWQLQHQMDQQTVASKYGNMPEEVRADGAKRFTMLKQRYGDVATMDDAMDAALANYVKRQMASGQAVKFNQMSQGLQIQSGMPNVSGGSQQQVSSIPAPPTQRADWDRLSIDQQAVLISQWEKAGGNLI